MPNGPLTPEQTAILITAIVVFLYVLFFILFLIFLLHFNRELKKNAVALTVIFAEKKDVLLSLYALYDKASVPLDDADKEATAKVRWLKTNVLKGSEIEAVAQDLSMLQRRLTLLAENETYIKRSEDFQAYKNTLGDLDVNYHRVVAVYNRALNGYEYWRKVLLYRLWFWLLGFRKRARLS
jgi:hypothetical protein